MSEVLDTLKTGLYENEGNSEKMLGEGHDHVEDDDFFVEWININKLLNKNLMKNK